MPTSWSELETTVLTRAAAHAQSLLTRRLTDAGSSPFQYRVLAVLAGVEHRTQADLGRAADLDRSDVTATVRTLEAAGLVTRRPDPDHARRVLVALSPAGAAAFAELAIVVHEAQGEAFGALSRDDRVRLADLLRRVGP
ncbi:MarR family winged helix-turn-helix transcriptional regulator [Actinomycetospora soli]|uniref:MarR family winged helix-turn-helix transcriptional regulator n=1 Tax=Actinomycetospora soli TaxID=2893887 RepID=UPI001E55FAD9|nr:MarR family winged helix-turn-helix transcriptional regulator [Actinomycetospora soli]MCD2187468.1 MarR family winged helix-turn-helix transcriptional regulator [Actinomycetospora soli]